MPVLHALRLAALIIEALTSLLGARFVGLNFVGQYTASMVVGSFCALLLDGGASSRIQAAVQPSTTHGHAVDKSGGAATCASALIRARAERGWPVLGLAAVAIPLHLWTLLAISLSTMGALWERRWYLLADRPLGKLATSYVVRPVLLLLALCCIWIAGIHAQPAAIGFIAASSLGFAVIRKIDISVGPGRQVARLRWRRLQPLRGYDWRLTLTNALGMSFPLLAVSSLRVFSGPTSVGIYALAYRPIQASLSLVALQRDLWLSRPGSLNAQDRQRRVLMLTVRCVLLVIVLSVLVLTLHPFSFLVPSARGADISFVPLAFGAALVPGTSLIYAEIVRSGADSYILLLPTILCALLAVALMPALAYSSGPFGAALGISACEMSMLLSMLVLDRRYHRTESFPK